MSVSQEPKSKWGRKGGDSQSSQPSQPTRLGGVSCLQLPVLPASHVSAPGLGVPSVSSALGLCLGSYCPLAVTAHSQDHTTGKSLFQLQRSNIPKNKCFSAYQEPLKSVEITDSKGYLPGLLSFFSEAETLDAYLALLSKQCSCLSANSEVTSWKKVASNPGSYFKALAFQTISIGLIKYRKPRKEKETKECLCILNSQACWLSLGASPGNKGTSDQKMHTTRIQK